MKRLFYLCSLLCILVPLTFSSCTKTISTLNLVPVWTRVGDSQGAVDEEHDIASVESAEFSPDGKLIASGAKSGWEVRVWDVATGNLLWERKHEQEVEVVAFTRDGRYLATGGVDCKVRVWRASDGEPIRTLDHIADIDGMRFSHSGSLLATGDNAGQVNIWDTSDPDPQNWPSTPLYTVVDGPDENRPGGGSGNSDLNSINWTRDDRFIVTAGRNMVVKRWEVARMGDDDQGLRQTYTGFLSSIKSVRLSADDALIAAGGQKSPHALVLIWDYATGEVVKRIEHTHFPKIEAVEWTPDGRYLLTGGIEGLEMGPGKWNESMGNRQAEYPGNKGIGYIRIYDRQKGFDLVNKVYVYRQEYFHFNRDGSLLVSSHEDGTLRLWKVLTEPLQISP